MAQQQFSIPIDGPIRGHAFRQSSKDPQRVTITDMDSNDEVFSVDLNNDNTALSFEFDGTARSRYFIKLLHKPPSKSWAGLTLVGGAPQITGGLTSITIAGEDGTDKDFNDCMVILYFLNKK